MRITESAERHKMHAIRADRNKIVCKDCDVEIAEIETEIKSIDVMLERIEALVALRGIPGVLIQQREYIKNEYENIRENNHTGRVEFIVMILKELDEMWCRIIALRGKDWGVVIGFLEEYNGQVVYQKDARGVRVGLSLEHLGKRYHIKDRSILKESEALEVCNLGGSKDRQTREEFDTELRNRGVDRTKENLQEYRKYQTLRYITGIYQGKECKLGRELGDKVEIEWVTGEIVEVNKKQISKIRIRGL